MVNPGFTNEPQYQQQQQQGNGMAVAGMVLGIIALVLFWVPFLNWVLALLGIIFGALGISRGNKVGRGKGFAIAGLICGLIAAILGVVIWLMLVRGVKEFAHKVKSLDGELEANRLSRSAKASAVENGAFPKGSVGPTPAGDCCTQPGNMCKTSSADWQNPVWQALNFEQFEDKTIYQFSYESADGKTFTAKVEGDADCDGTKQTWQIHGSIGADGVPTTEVVKPTNDD